MTDSDAELIEELARYSKDPYGFALFAFPWGEPGELENHVLDAWQIAVLKAVGNGLLDLSTAVQIAVASGHGVGKSALVAILIYWAMSTMPDTRGVVTANTENQLKTKTWVEVNKWYRLFIGRHLFKISATRLCSVDPEHSETWRMDLVPWSEKNTEAFAGLHNQGRRIIVIFDEASAIPDVIWETTEGALTDEDTEIIWIAFGNPTRNQGRFRECHSGGRFSHRWRSMSVDSRTCRITNKRQLEQWVADWGEDSDFVRVRVLGQFPHTDATSFISRDEAVAAALREDIFEDDDVPVVLGVDVARFGKNTSVIYARQGRDAWSRPPRRFQGISTVQLVNEIVKAAEEWGAFIINIDGGGVGGGVVDQTRERIEGVNEVLFGSAPTLPVNGGERYLNKRAEIYGHLRQWLKRGKIRDMVTNEVSLVEQLIGPTYAFNKKDLIVLESKEDMERRGVESPDDADALALTFAEVVPARIASTRRAPKVAEDYNPYEEKRIFPMRTGRERSNLHGW